MNILQITPRLPSPPNDGGAVYVFYTTKYLSQLGEDVQIASFISNKHEQNKNLVEQYARIYAIDGEFRPYSFGAILKSILTRKPITVQHRMIAAIMDKALNKITVTPDIILLEGLQTAAFIDILRTKFGETPIVLRQVNVEHLLLERNSKSTSNPFLKAFYFDQARLMKRFELKAMQNADSVTAITEYDKDIYKKSLPKLDCFVSPAGAETPENLTLQRKSECLLSISNWRWRPNVDGLKWFLEEVWPDLIDKYPSIQFDVAGNGLSEKFRAKYSSPNINYLGFVDDLEPLRQSSTIFIAPLFSGSGMKLKIVEGLASGLPIITTKFGAEGIEIEHNVHYREANTKQEFINEISELLNSKNIRLQLEKNAKHIAKQKYSWKEITKKLIHHLNEVKQKTDRD